MSNSGYFIDWDGNARSTSDPGGGYLCEADTIAKYVAVTAKSGTLVHEAALYKSLHPSIKRRCPRCFRLL